MTDGTIRSIAISGRLAMSMHSLNNEGTEGNEQLTRMVTVVRQDGRLESVNAVSGDMFKHILAEHLHRISLGAGVALSEGARRFSANRIMMSDGSPGATAKDSFEKWLEEQPKDASAAAIVDEILKRCAVTDTLGILITAGNKSVPRKSVVEFGWVVGIPGEVRTESYFHVKYDPERGGSRGQEQQTGQAIFHRPASSGRYAVIATVEVDRIGFNDISRQYVLPEDERIRRARALLESVVATFVEPAGAQRNTQNPHILAFDGVISASLGPLPAPTVSALNPDFADQLEGIRQALNGLHPATVESHRFGSISEFVTKMKDLIDSVAPNTPKAA